MRVTARPIILWLIFLASFSVSNQALAIPYSCISSEQTPFLKKIRQGTDVSGFSTEDWEQGTAYDLGLKLKDDYSALKNPTGLIPDAEGLFESVESCINWFEDEDTANKAREVRGPLAISAMRESKDNGNEAKARRYIRLAEQAIDAGSNEPNSQSEATRLIELEQLKTQFLPEDDTQPKSRSDVIAIVRQQINTRMDDGSFSGFGNYLKSARQPLEDAMGLLYASAIAKERALQFILKEIGTSEPYDTSNLSTVEKDSLLKAAELYKKLTDETPKSENSNYIGLKKLRAAIAEQLKDSAKKACFYPKRLNTLDADKSECIAYEDDLWSANYPPQFLENLVPIRNMDLDVQYIINRIKPKSLEKSDPTFKLADANRSMAGNIFAVIDTWETEEKPLPLLASTNGKDGLDSQLIGIDDQTIAKNRFSELFDNSKGYERLSFEITHEHKEKIVNVPKTLCGFGVSADQSERLRLFEGASHQLLKGKRADLAKYLPKEPDYFDGVCNDVKNYFLPEQKR